MPAKTVTTVREYDDEGRLIREVRTEVEHQPAVVVDGGQWWRPQPGWWQNPIISSTTTNQLNRAQTV